MSGTARNRGALDIGLEAAVTIMGCLVLAGALAANQGWWDRHFLPLFFYSREKFLLSEHLVRLAGAAIGLALIVFGRKAVRSVMRRMSARELAGASLRILVAVGLALAACEGIMGRNFSFAAAEHQPGEEPVRRPDPRLGWVYTPARDGSTIVGGRRISYAIDPLGYRVADRGKPVDVALPSIVFTGESIISGYGLSWDESIPAQVGAALGMQSASIAVFGYANDQAYLRLISELPRFHGPVAVVSLFTPSLLARNLGDDRPYLGPDLSWQPAIHRPWLSRLWHFYVPYRSRAEIERGIATVRAELVASETLARRRGAIALVVDPQFGPETVMERTLRKRILEESGVAFLQVKLDPGWHLQGDHHPDARAAHAIAMAIAQRLRRDLGARPGADKMGRESSE
jgi:hypothetical protein